MMRDKLPKIVLSALLVVALAFSWLRPLDATALSRVDEGFQRALASYAIARTLNAVISVAQGTEVSLQVGVGATFAPGQVLDPLNDLVEQFGDWMLAASVGFGIMHVLIEIGGFWFFSLLLTLSAAAWLWLRWRKGAVPALLTQAVIVLLLVRFAVPVAMIGSDWTFKQFMQADYNRHLAGIDGNAKMLEEESGLAGAGQKSVSAPDGNEPSFFSKLADMPKYFGAKMEKLKGLAEQSVTHILRLITLFLLQTLIIPLALLWLLYRLGIGACRSAGAKSRRIS
ncbi:MAG: hypothetical protein CO069_00815 [Gallionellaceae bacterium CG_4_9_14_0_8_um_filter_60_335]|nr:MAG: hypothetical protein CO069_00815 [Gallionellaceae bacterium CG_4_9_14_0_8_um_filter_60_335]